MTSRLKTIAALIMVGSALVATPILAASKIEGNPGTPDLAVPREMLTVIPAPDPTNLPTLTPGAVSRELGQLSEEDLLNAYGSVTRHADGSVETIGPSEALKTVIAAEYKH